MDCLGWMYSVEDFVKSDDKNPWKLSLALRYIFERISMKRICVNFQKGVSACNLNYPDQLNFKLPKSSALVKL